MNDETLRYALQQERITELVSYFVTELIDILGDGLPRSRPQYPDRWLKGGAALEMLGREGSGVTKAVLYHRRKSGIYTEGKHYRNIASVDARKPTYEWNVDAIMRLGETTPQRHRR